MGRKSLEIKKQERGKGKPTLDSYTDPDQLNTRQKEFCDYLCDGISPSDAGELLTPPAGEQQVTRWVENIAIQTYIAQKGIVGVSDENKALYTVLEREVLKEFIRKAKIGEVDLTMGRAMIERMQTKVGIAPKKEPESGGLEKPTSTMAKFIKEKEEKNKK